VLRGLHAHTHTHVDTHAHTHAHTHTRTAKEIAPEVERVKASGGWVYDGRVCNILAVSRAFGDWEFKVCV